MANQDNKRLGIPINALSSIVTKFATPSTGLSRADVWVQAMYTAINMVNKGSAQPITFTMNWVGRVDCEKAGQICRNARGQTVSCSVAAGPHRNIADPNMNSNDFANFWATRFNGMDLTHAIALMGCHTVGRLFKAVCV